MKVVMRDGRVFQGTALQIVKAMHDIAFGVEQMTLDQYIDWVVENARRFEEVELAAKGVTTEERAKALVDEMIAKGLAARLVGLRARPSPPLSDHAAISSTRRPCKVSVVPPMPVTLDAQRELNCRIGLHEPPDAAPRLDTDSAGRTGL